MGLCGFKGFGAFRVFWVQRQGPRAKKIAHRWRTTPLRWRGARLHQMRTWNRNLESRIQRVWPFILTSPLLRTKRKPPPNLPPERAEGRAMKLHLLRSDGLNGPTVAPSTCASERPPKPFREQSVPCKFSTPNKSSPIQQQYTSQVSILCLSLARCAMHT